MKFNQAKNSLDHGSSFPYDATDEWWAKPYAENPQSPQPKDWAHKAARGIISDLSDRGGIKRGFEQLDEEIRIEIVESLSEIIREAYKEKTQ